MTRTADVVVLGAGMAGVAAAWHLAERRGAGNVAIVDPEPPLSVTSDKSTECYRNWWPGPDAAMTGFMNRSIDLMEDLARASGNVFRMSRRGYAFATADPGTAAELRRTAEQACAFGAGELRVHGAGTGGPAYDPAPVEGFEDQPDGADVFVDAAPVREHFPWLDESARALVHARRCGWLSAQQLGMHLLERARARGAHLVRGRVEEVRVEGDRVRGVRIAGDAGNESIATDRLVIAAGPLVREAGAMLGVDLPVFCERHLKASFRDERGGMPGRAPLLVWSDPVRLPWTPDERAALAGAAQTAPLLDELPAGVHGRPSGRPGTHHALVLWTWDDAPVEPVFPVPDDPLLPEIAIRGMSVMLPAMRAYLDRLPRCAVDGGYYCKTADNRPLVGALPVEGAFVSAAWSGYGVMAGCAGGELVAAHVAGDALPAYAGAFDPARFEDPDYASALAGAAGTGQL